MENLKTKIRRFIYIAKHRWLVFDNVVIIVCLVLCLWWTYGSISAMTRNWTLAETLAGKRTELALVTLEVETLELENAYYSSDEYAELSARAKFDRALPGESLVYLPPNSEYAKTKHAEEEPPIPESPSNPEKWFSFLFGPR